MRCVASLENPGESSPYKRIYLKIFAGDILQQSCYVAVSCKLASRYRQLFSIASKLADLFNSGDANFETIKLALTTAHNKKQLTNSDKLDIFEIAKKNLNKNTKNLTENVR